MPKNRYWTYMGIGFDIISSKCVHKKDGTDSILTKEKAFPWGKVEHAGGMFLAEAVDEVVSYAVPSTSSVSLSAGADGCAAWISVEDETRYWR